MTRRRKRELSEEERELWRHVVRHVEPLKAKAARKGAAKPGWNAAERRAPETSTAAPPPVPPAAPPPPRAASAPPKPRAPTAAPYRPAPPPPPAIPPLTALARKERTALKRRARAPDATIDLHGMRQAEAHAALVGFLHRAVGQGHAIVLVITGKGGPPGAGALFDERGVLRRVVPHWLREPTLRGIVVGFEAAAHHHGGEGALYVRLRRRGAR